MLFAQTGTNSTVPRKIADAEVNPYLIALWWIVPLAIAAIWIAITVRSNNAKAKAKAKQRLSQAEATKSKEIKKTPPSSVTVGSETTPIDSSETRRQTDRQPKKKKEKTKSKQKTEPITPSVSASPEVATGDMIAEKQSTELEASNANPAIAEPKPSNAIFEPLRDASRGRRKVYNDESMDNRDERGDSTSRENDAYNQIFGGKFERIIPKQSLRSVANRWPTEETQPAKTAMPVVASTQPSNPVATPTNANSETQVETPAPAKGLKSFVSKVKSMPETPE